MIALVNYGLGNIQAFATIYKRLNIPLRVACCAKDLDGVDRVILPGVGAFDWAMTRLNESGMREKLDELVLTKQIPALGVCVGMQIMADKSEEGRLKGLGWIHGEVKRFSESAAQKAKGERISLPHMGWNDVIAREGVNLFLGLERNSLFYFLHSYYFVPQQTASVIATTNYHGEFASSVRSRNAYGVQFHPEKSHGSGLRLLENFSII